MTEAILPLNVSALRVNNNDAENLTIKFKGRTAVFEKMPFTPASKIPSTGNAIVQLLESTATPASTLRTGIHLHWELPDVYKRGAQGPNGGNPVFPHAPNTWLVLRYLQVFDPASKLYKPTQTKGFIVESDYVSLTPDLDRTGAPRPTITVPLPDNPPPGQQPYRYMGRVVDYEDWTGPGDPSDYLDSYGDNYLTAIGFVGPSFASYYPECCSVFGFWDNFSDLPDIAAAIESNEPIKFRVSYQVIGWVRDAGKDVLVPFKDTVTKAYDDYVAQAQAEKAEIAITPVDEVARIASQNYKLSFNKDDITYALNPDKTIKSIDLPARGLCSGVMQEIVWNMDTDPGSRYFLNNPTSSTTPNAIWVDDQLEMAVGNTTVEGMSALIKHDTGGTASNDAQKLGMEMLLDALQMGMLHDIETKSSSLIELDEALHSRAFGKVAGGYLWAVDKRSEPGQKPRTAPSANDQITLPLDLAELLNTLNKAQKAYDQGRAELDTIRKQLFMDWQRWVANYIDPVSSRLHVPPSVLTAFIDNQSPESELGYVIQRSKEVGIQRYRVDSVTGEVTGLDAPEDMPSLAGAVYAAWEAVKAALPANKPWDLIATAAPNFWLPTDPVLVMEGDRLQPVRRNGNAALTPVRLLTEVLNELVMEYTGATFTLAASTIKGLPALTASTPMPDPIQACIREAALLVPMLAGQVGQAVQELGSGNPAQADLAKFVEALNRAQGGTSPLDPVPVDGGLYGALHADGAKPELNAKFDIEAPLAISFTFTNAGKTGWSPYGPAITAQTALPSFDPQRVDPFLPAFMLWNVTLDPLIRDADQNFEADTLTTRFELDADAVDYTYPVKNGSGDFTTGTPVSYSGSVLLSHQPTKSLTSQIDRYEQTYPNDPDADALNAAKTAYEHAQILSQGIGGFNDFQLLREVIARVRVEDLVQGIRDQLTLNVNAAAQANRSDNWYDYGFNTLQPISQGLLADNNFGPLRAGFAQVFDVEIIDVFGQRMQVSTKNRRPDNSQVAEPSFALRPAEGDTAHANDIYLPPRLLAPSRVWFRWLSAEHDSKLKGYGGDFVEMNSHPATSPVCGFVLPNHLDGSLFFYQAGGTAIGSFGVEHGVLVYRSRPGGTDSLAEDIGAWQSKPLVNEHLYDVMWRIQHGGADFLTGMMNAILGSEGFLNPERYAQDVSLSVLIGQPLAITRAVVGLESLGRTVPVSQADTDATSPFSEDVTQGRYRYADRQAASSAALEAVKVPVRLGNLAHIDDGMIGFFLDGSGTEGPYGDFYAPAAKTRAGGVAPPDPATLQVKLNAQPQTVTFLMDPRGPVHATTGILPVAQLLIPPDQYTQAMSRLQVTFFTHPVLQGADALRVPLPLEAGYQWAWVQPGFKSSIRLAAQSGSEIARFGFSPQTLLEGYAELQKAPPPPANPPKSGDADE